MKTKIILPTLFLIVLLAGCAGRLMTPVYAPVPPGSTNPPVIVGYLPNTNATGALGTAGQIGGLLPSPANWIVEGVATLGLLGLGAYARIKSAQAIKGQTILNAVIAGVEAAGNALPSGIDPVKKSISTHVAATGNGPEFDAQVQAVARNL